MTGDNKLSAEIEALQRILEIDLPKECEIEIQEKDYGATATPDGQWTRGEQKITSPIAKVTLQIRGGQMVKHLDDLKHLGLVYK